MTSILEGELTRDAFLGGRLQVWQPRRGYRAGVDPVLLAAAVQAGPEERVLELGCGVGVASLCLASRTGAAVTGLEMQPDYADLARRNASENSLPFEVLDGDLRAMPAALRAQSFDHVLANPPYFERARGTAARDAGREAALGEGADLAEWVDAAVRRLKPRGYLTFIQRADRLPDLLAACDARLGDLRVLPIAPRAGRAAELVILRARKGALGAFAILAPLVMHEGAGHVSDGESYCAEVQDVLRRAAPLKVVW
ncbi:tRNA (adenine37-N(6))-methyltransferase TrmN6 [Candidatus Rhodobacter oscarellae]|uniref:tRNA (Adenine37-N(6))-methyltransferase TrmN6 n=1 Tax=Candidatus Rhodobacter oscarellae TaxID=1675527 RepID=A0A0J9EAU9_9RHOB|nr:methyltransferase domain-containing protein [Candidatus Rhodobacter lobularis]KMW59910.1 tRNA (adenine37-N(6))-methyltransferase TrmN6 [Candidatus Rhodobacter lobularis]